MEEIQSILSLTEKLKCTFQEIGEICKNYIQKQKPKKRKEISSEEEKVEGRRRKVNERKRMRELENKVQEKYKKCRHQYRDLTEKELKNAIRSALQAMEKRKTFVSDSSTSESLQSMI